MHRLDTGRGSVPGCGRAGSTTWSRPCCGELGRLVDGHRELGVGHRERRQLGGDLAASRAAASVRSAVMRAASPSTADARCATAASSPSMRSSSPSSSMSRNPPERRNSSRSSKRAAVPPEQPAEHRPTFLHDLEFAGAVGVEARRGSPRARPAASARANPAAASASAIGTRAASCASDAVEVPSRRLDECDRVGGVVDRGLGGDELVRLRSGEPQVFEVREAVGALLQFDVFAGLGVDGLELVERGPQLRGLAALARHGLPGAVAARRHRRATPGTPRGTRASAGRQLSAARTGRAPRAARRTIAAAAGRPDRARRRAPRRARRARPTGALRPPTTARLRPSATPIDRAAARPPSISPPVSATRSAIAPDSGTSQRPSTHACFAPIAPRPRRRARRAAARAPSRPWSCPRRSHR